MLDSDFHISTPRLNISYLDSDNDAHCDFFVTLARSPEMADLNKARPAPVLDRAAAHRDLASSTSKLAATGWGRYIISLRDDTSAADASIPFSQRPHTYIGTVSMQLARYPDAPTVPDVGFALLARYYNNGYATEAALGLIQHFRETKGQKAFAGYTSPDNVASNRMFARMGFEDRGVKEVKGIVADGRPWLVRVWSLGLEGELADFNI